MRACDQFKYKEYGKTCTSCKVAKVACNLVCEKYKFTRRHAVVQ